MQFILYRKIVNLEKRLKTKSYTIRFIKQKTVYINKPYFKARVEFILCY